MPTVNFKASLHEGLGRQLFLRAFGQITLGVRADNDTWRPYRNSLEWCQPLLSEINALRVSVAWSPIFGNEGAASVFTEIEKFFNNGDGGTGGPENQLNHPAGPAPPEVIL